MDPKTGKRKAARSCHCKTPSQKIFFTKMLLQTLKISSMLLASYCRFHHHDGWQDFRESAPYIGCCRSVFQFAWLTGSILWRAKFLTLPASRIRKQCSLQRSHTTQPAANKKEAIQFYKDRRVKALVHSVPFSRAIDTIRLADCGHPIAGPTRWRAVFQHTC